MHRQYRVIVSSFTDVNHDLLAAGRTSDRARGEDSFSTDLLAPSTNHSAVRSMNPTASLIASMRGASKIRIIFIFTLIKPR